MRASLLLLILWCADGYGNHHKKYCESYCNGLRCIECAQQGKPLPFTAEKCAKCMSDAPISECKGYRCHCPPNPGCGPEKSCNCSAFCTNAYCKSCPSQTLYTKSQCAEACQQSNTPDCRNKPCPCPYIPCCNCSTLCTSSYCKSCPTQTTYTQEQCKSALQAAQTPDCQNLKCKCAARYCPPKSPNCSAICACGYCESCPAQTFYTASQCQQACQEAREPQNRNVTCGCPAQPACPPANCCPANCYGAFCDSCKTQTLFPPQKCAEYARDYKNPACKSVKCICPRIELFCPNPKYCNCSAVCISGYCQDCKTQTTYSNATCNDAYEQSKSLDCQGARCGCPAQPACPPANCCPGKCYGNFCETCKTQTLFPPQKCAEYAREYKDPACAGAKCLCPRIELYCPNPKNCNCSSACISSYCKECPTQTFYSNCTCNAAYEQSNTPDCKAAKCSCPAQPACPPETCCPGKCFGPFCESCKTQTLFSPQTCAEYVREYKNPACKTAKCFCPGIELFCPNPRNCNCSAVCISSYCQDCKTQTTYSNATCNAAYEQAKSLDCQGVKCNCPLQPACPPTRCNCSARCFGPFCESCPTQTLFPPQACAQYAREYKNPACKTARCFCPAIELYCPKPQNCNCSAACICSYCNECKTQNIYSNCTCARACAQSDNPDCKAAKCHCSSQPACPAENCTCPAKCYGPYCASCPTQTLFPPQTCAEYAREYKSAACKDLKCFCPQIELYCPNPKNCNCSAACISSYCKTCKTQKVYSNSTCEAAYQQSNTPDCGAANCSCPAQPACPPVNCCPGQCYGNFCETCKTQTLFSPQKCAEYAREYKDPACAGAKCVCPRIELYCPNPKNCNCSAVCINSYCKACPTRNIYSNCTCQAAYEQSNIPDCEAANCSCPAQPACPPETCCPGKCYGEFCECCSTQTLFPPDKCAEYAREYKNPACMGAKCICPAIELYCPNPKNCNCSAVCINSYCKECPTQTIYSNRTCQTAYEQSNTPDCKAAKCSCPAQPACPSKCNCSAFCQAPYCESCPSQIIYPPETCASWIKQAKSPECKKPRCICPLVIPYCPKPENCDCEQVRISKYCKQCPKQRKYSKPKCASADSTAESEDCRAAKCDCSKLPPCDCY